MKLAGVQVGAMPAMLDHEVAQDVAAARRVDDLGVELDAVQVALGSARPAYGVESVWAVERKPSGSRVIESPWLIQTGCSRSSPANSPSSAVIVTLAGPYSRWSAADVAAELAGHQLRAVADAQDGDAAGPDRRVGPGAPAS